MRNKEQDALGAYVAEQEGTQEILQTPAPQTHMTTAESARAQRLHGRDDLPTEEETGLKYRDNLGYLKIDVASLPTQGMFYPEGTEIRIRAARGEEIKHWSTMNDQDLNQLSQVDDILNYIIERCVSVKLPGIMGGNWKDLKDVDRFYLLLAVREFTFLDGDNEPWCHSHKECTYVVSHMIIPVFHKYMYRCSKFGVKVTHFLVNIQ